MSMSVPIAMVDASTSASTQEAPTGVNATVATIYKLMGRAVQPLLQVVIILLHSLYILKLLFYIT